MQDELLPTPIQETSVVNIEECAMSVAGLVKQVDLIQNVMEHVMQEDEHFGTIPGTKKPTLYKPGAEKLCLTFRLDPDYEIIREVRDTTFIAYTIKCTLFHIPTKAKIASGIGSCNSRETKYRWRYDEESTGKALPKTYWDARKAGNNKEMKRILGGDGFRAAKIDNVWVIAKSQKVENDNPWDLDNTLIKMACKRALVAATLNATAASDIFTQDLEDMPRGTVGNGNEGKNGGNGKSETQKEPPKEIALNLLKDNIKKAGFSEGDLLKVAKKERLTDFTIKSLNTMNGDWAQYAGKVLNATKKPESGPVTESECPLQEKPVNIDTCADCNEREGCPAHEKEAA